MRIFICFLAVALTICNGIIAVADEAELVALVETDDSLCLAHGGKLVALQLTEAAMAAPDSALEVWVDRWFMQVQTADHTKHILTVTAPEKELGCSNSIAGPQHWTLSTIKRLPANNEPARKELP